MGNTPITMHSGPGYVRVVRRHLMPHAYHRADKDKLFLSSRKDSTVLRMPELPASFPLHIYSGAGGCQQHRQVAIQPRTFSAMRMWDHTAAFAIRGVANWETLPSTHFFEPVEAWWTDPQPATVSIMSTSLSTYLRQLQHANELIRSSTLHGLFNARRSMYPDMPCYQQG